MPTRTSRVLAILAVALILLAAFVLWPDRGGELGRSGAGGAQVERPGSDATSAQLAEIALTDGDGGGGAIDDEEARETIQVGGDDGLRWSDLLRPVDAETGVAIPAATLELVAGTGERTTVALAEAVAFGQLDAVLLARLVADGHVARPFDPAPLREHTGAPIEVAMLPAIDVVVEFAEWAEPVEGRPCTVTVETDLRLGRPAPTADSASANAVVLEEGRARLERVLGTRPIGPADIRAVLDDPHLSSLLAIDEAPSAAAIGSFTIEATPTGRIFVAGVPAATALSVRAEPELHYFAWLVGAPGVDPADFDTNPYIYEAGTTAQVFVGSRTEPGVLLGRLPSTARNAHVEAHFYDPVYRSTGGPGLTGSRVRPDESGAFEFEPVYEGPFRVIANWDEGDRFFRRTERSGDIAAGEVRDLGVLDASGGGALRLTIVASIEVDGEVVDHATDPRFADLEFSFAVNRADGRISAADSLHGAVIGFAPCGVVGLSPGPHSVWLRLPNLPDDVLAGLRCDGWEVEDPLQIDADTTITPVLRYTSSSWCSVRARIPSWDGHGARAEHWGSFRARNTATEEVVTRPVRVARGLSADRETTVRSSLQLGPGEWEVAVLIRPDRFELERRGESGTGTLGQLRGWAGSTTVVVPRTDSAPAELALTECSTLVGPKSAFGAADDLEHPPTLVLVDEAPLLRHASGLVDDTGTAFAYIGLQPGATYRVEGTDLVFVAASPAGTTVLDGLPQDR